jgi:glycine/D-amino acid oxidase-like deaminating enzyme
MNDQREQRSQIYDVMIVGGGISGLSFAYECQKAGVHYLLLELCITVQSQLPYRNSAALSHKRFMPTAD